MAGAHVSAQQARRQRADRDCTSGTLLVRFHNAMDDDNA